MDLAVCNKALKYHAICDSFGAVIRQNQSIQIRGNAQLLIFDLATNLLTNALENGKLKEKDCLHDASAIRCVIREPTAASKDYLEWDLGSVKTVYLIINATMHKSLHSIQIGYSSDGVDYTFEGLKDYIVRYAKQVETRYIRLGVNCIPNYGRFVALEKVLAFENPEETVEGREIKKEFSETKAIAVFGHSEISVFRPVDEEFRRGGSMKNVDLLDWGKLRDFIAVRRNASLDLSRIFGESATIDLFVRGGAHVSIKNFNWIHMPAPPDYKVSSFKLHNQLLSLPSGYLELSMWMSNTTVFIKNDERVLKPIEGWCYGQKWMNDCLVDSPLLYDGGALNILRAYAPAAEYIFDLGEVVDDANLLFCWDRSDWVKISKSEDGNTWELVDLTKTCKYWYCDYYNIDRVRYIKIEPCYNHAYNHDMKLYNLQVWVPKEVF